MDSTTQTIFIIFTAITAISVLIQCGAIIGMLLIARRTEKKIHALMDDLRVHILPVVSTSHRMIDELSPKITTITSNLVDSTNNVRTMAEDVGGVVSEVTGRARVQAAHVDGMVQGTLNQISQAGQTLQHGFSVPVRQLNGILNGIRAGLDVLRRKDNLRDKEKDNLRDHEVETDLSGIENF